jgi:hypothetical protein
VSSRSGTCSALPRDLDRSVGALAAKPCIAGNAEVAVTPTLDTCSIGAAAASRSLRPFVVRKRRTAGTADAWRSSRRHRHRELCDGGPRKALVRRRVYARLLMGDCASPRGDARRAEADCCFQRWRLQPNGSQLAIRPALPSAQTRGLPARGLMLYRESRSWRCPLSLRELLSRSPSHWARINGRAGSVCSS